jgi:hypothetical protein
MNRHQRRVGISLLGFLVLSFFLPLQLASRDHDYSEPLSPQLPGPTNKVTASSVTDNGNDIDSVMLYSRKVQGLDVDIMNSFADTASHQATVDFTSYQLSGWSLYEVLMNATRIVAATEREVVGTSATPSNLGFNVFKQEIGVYYNQLAQGFYNMSHDGLLQNISLLYDTPTYDPAYQNYAYIDIRSNYQDGTTNITSSVQLNNVLLNSTWTTVTQSAILNAQSVYYIVLNGTKLIEYSSIYPTIRWYYQDSSGTFLTRRHNIDGDTWGGDRPFEALVNYTYIPWNTTSNSALEYQDAQTLSLKGNSSMLTGTEWSFNSSSNISSVTFSTNQSVSMEYELTLRYRKNITSTTQWYASTSGSSVNWNITSALDYPNLSGALDKNLSLTIPSDWTVDHLFNDTTPIVYHDTFQQKGGLVECNQLSDAKWILSCNSPNYIRSMQKFDTSDDSLISNVVSIVVNVDINSTIESPSSIPATSGSANLRILYQSSIEYSTNVTVTAGTSHHQWDISLYTTSNGLRTVELYWINGTEAGYLTSDVVVY